MRVQPLQLVVAGCGWCLVLAAGVALAYTEPWTAQRGASLAAFLVGVVMVLGSVFLDGDRRKR